MSYLVDALKKAERERHAQHNADLRSLSASEAPAPNRAGNHALRTVVSVLILCNLGLFAYMLIPGGGPQQADAADPASSGQPAGASPRLTKTDPPGRPVPASRSAQVAYRSADEINPSGPRVQPPGDARALTGLRLSSGPAQSRPAADAAASQANARARYASAPLHTRTPPAGLSQHASRARHEATSSGGAPGGAPRVTINGHLYSSVPGRSFILVHGHRYHEGERLASGPAVVSIDVTGATLNYRGRRYHVKGPG